MARRGLPSRDPVEAGAARDRQENPYEFVLCTVFHWAVGKVSVASSVKRGLPPIQSI